MKLKNVLIIGSGGREHALAWALARSPQVAQVFVAPGNAGTDWPANPEPAGLQPRAASSNVPIAVDNFPALIDFATLNNIALTVVGPEVPLVLGIVDAFRTYRNVCPSGANVMFHGAPESTSMPSGVLCPSAS